MNYDSLAYLEFIDGQNDAIELLSPQSKELSPEFDSGACTLRDSYYYLQGWHDTKRKLASGELCWVYEEEQPQPVTDDDWEVF
jgi:hypothetical protein